MTQNRPHEQRFRVLQTAAAKSRMGSARFLQDYFSFYSKCCTIRPSNCPFEPLSFAFSSSGEAAYDLRSRSHPIRQDELPPMRERAICCFPLCRWACGIISATSRPSAHSATSCAAFDHGITHFDLANNYGPPYGEAERNFGVHMQRDWKPHRDELVLSTKGEL